MKLIVGLGNPSAKYAGNRHNIGFMALDRLAQSANAPFRPRFQGELSELRYNADKIYLLKPSTFMNLSGQSVGEAMRYFKLTPRDILVIHDELDLAPGKIRFKSGGGHAGHNGLRSIHEHIGENYHRLRMGIGHPGHKDKVPSYVLHDFAKADAAWLEPLLDAIEAERNWLLRGDGQKFVAQIMQRIAPPARKSSPTKPKTQEPPKTVSSEPQEQKSAIARLIDRFS